MRRVYVPALQPGPLTPDPQQAHHLRSVLRLAVGDTVEAFDAAGRSGLAVVEATEPQFVLRVDAVAPAPPAADVVVAAAVPKGDRADWMVEKLGELGVARFVPLRTARSVVHPEGRSKIERWQRIAVESAKQCRRPGVLTIDPLTDLPAFLNTIDRAAAIYCSTNPMAQPINASFIVHRSSFLLIGPEGDWTPAEEADFVRRGLTAASLGRTILRVETAAVVAAGLVTLLRPPPAESAPIGPP